MSENTDTIIGGPTTGADGPDSADGDDPTPPDAPGDATTAIHRARLYSLLALGFERPGDDLAAALDERAFREDLPESAAVVDEDLAAAARAIGGCVDDVDALHDRWASLFGVEEGVSVSPYELTYLPGPLVTNVRRLADIRGFYRAFDLQVADARNDRGDHVCFQAEFLQHLSLREAYLRTEGDQEGVAVVVDARGSFLEDHLGRWFWRFADEVGNHDDGFYAALAEVLAALLEAEIDRLDLDPDWVPDDPQVAEWTEDVFGDSGRGCGGCGYADDAQGIDTTDFGHGHLVGESPAGADDADPDRSPE